MQSVLYGLGTRVHTVIAGLGGRTITRKSLRSLFEKAQQGDLPDLTFLDLARDLVDRQIERELQCRRSGPTAENILKDLGVTTGRIH